MEPISQKKLIKELSIRPQKRLGQNFIVKDEILNRIVERGNFQPNDMVVEIGAGLGGLTTRLAEKAKTVLAIEKDAKLANLLRTKIIKQKNIKIIHQDALRFDYDWACSEAGRPLKIAGNLPFYIASPLTIDLLKKIGQIESMILMYQKEVADRILAAPGNKNYGFLTIMANLYADLEMVLAVGKDAFYPQPQVDSKVIRFKLLNKPRERLENENFFIRVVKSAFSQRRKKLRNSLRSISKTDLPTDVIEKICRAVQIDPDQRGETLNLKQFALLSNQMILLFNKTT